MSITFEEGRNNQRVFNLLVDLGDKVDFAVQKGSYRAGQALKAEASHEVLKGNKTGRIYIRRDRAGRRRRHKSSAPGETHANMTGALRRSLSFNVAGSRQLEFGYGLQSGKPAPHYAGIEFGMGKVEPRPTLFNAIKKKENDISNLYEREIDEVFG